jgi:hypothetical protein
LNLRPKLRTPSDYIAGCLAGEAGLELAADAKASRRFQIAGSSVILLDDVNFLTIASSRPFCLLCRRSRKRLKGLPGILIVGSLRFDWNAQFIAWMEVLLSSRLGQNLFIFRR